jgi:beta-lactamase class A
LGKRSFPSGITQDWPDNAPITVETLATLMISLSDNTATDTLMSLAGRERIEARVIASGHETPERMLPMLTTWEAFTLKAQPPERIAAYVAANRAERSALIDALKPASDVTSNSKPASIDSVEWFASANDIARVFDTLRRRKDPRVLAILGVAPHLPPDAAARFARIGYKGGSEPGVLNLSWLLQGKDGQWYVATASWNDPDKPVDQTKFELLAMRLIGLVSN